VATSVKTVTHRRPRHPIVAGCVVLACGVLSAACGARLTSSTLDAARGRGTPSAAGSSAPGAQTADATTVPAAAVTPGDTTVSAAPTAVGSSSPIAGQATARAPSSIPAVGSTISPFSGPPAGGNGGATDVGVSATEIDLGNVVTQGGPVPGLFSGAYYGAAAYAAYVNSQGGIYGRRLVVKTHDDQLQAAQNKADIDAFIPQVLGFVGSFSLEDAAGAPDMAAAGTPDVGVGLTPDRQQLAVNFAVNPIGHGFAIGPLLYFKQRFGPAVTDHVAFFIEDNPAAIANANLEQAALVHAGYKIVYSRKIEATETNFQGDVTTMQGDGVKGLIFQGEVSTMARMASAMHDGHFTIPFADWGAPAYDPGFISLANGGAEGAVLYQQLAMYAGEDSATLPEVSLFDQWLKRVAPSQTPDLFAAYAWASGALLTQALIKAGPHLTRQSLLAALKTFDNFDDNGMFAPVGPASKRSPTCFIVIDVKGGKFVRDAADPPTGYRCSDGGYYNE
jgi:branched-chain amino acid transport system substrate-binding protein